MRRAGQNIYDLARRRRGEALQVWGAALLLVLLPIGLGAAGTLLAIPLYGLCLMLAGGLVWRGRSCWQGARRADQGAAAEADIAGVLAVLADQWQVEYGVQHPTVGDVDVVLRSPRGQVYTIDVKSHKGTVRSASDTLYRQYGPTRYAFEKDFLKQAKRQAVVIRDLKQVRFVTPLLVFANATVEIATNPVAGVHVIAKSQLINCLQTLG